MSTLIVTVRDDAICVSREFDPTFAFDLEGRLTGAFVGGVSHVRGLSGRIQERWRVTDRTASPRLRRWLDPGEVDALIGAAGTLVNEARQALASGPDSVKLVAAGNRITATASTFEEWAIRRRVVSAEDHRHDGERFSRLVRPIGIMPPDQYRSLVVQLAMGCPHNRCTFCTFYRAAGFRVVKEDGLERQLDGLVDLLGRGISRFRGVFAADANPFVMGEERLARVFEIIGRKLPAPEGEGGTAPSRRWPIHAFVDTFSPRPAGETAWRRLAALGLTRVFVGLESGDPRVIELLAKPVHLADAKALATELAAAGISVGWIVLLGAGGRELALSHVGRTVESLAQLAPGPGDIIYLSPLFVSATSPYMVLARRAGLTPLPLSGMMAQAEAIRNGLKTRLSSPPRVALYDIRDFVF